MFENALLNNLGDNFNVNGFSDIPVFFGDAPEGTPEPYIIMYSLDSDGTPQLLCDNIFDSGEAFIQFNVFTNDIGNGFFIRQKLDEYLYSISSPLTLNADNYRIVNVLHNASPSTNLKTNGLATNILSKTFNYYKD